MIRQAAVVGLSFMPFAVSIVAAYAAWETIYEVAILWRMITMTLVWIGTFAAATQLFWKGVELLAQGRQ